MEAVGLKGPGWWSWAALLAGGCEPTSALFPSCGGSGPQTAAASRSRPCRTPAGVGVNVGRADSAETGAAGCGLQNYWGNS